MSDMQKVDMMSELEDGLKDTIVLEVIRRVQCNMSDYKDKMLEVCTLLNRKYGIEADRIQRILDGVSDNYVFYMMHTGEFAQWISLGVNCQKYADKKQIYIVSNYEELKK